MAVELVGIEVENLRGYEHARLSLEKRRTVLVGPNNSGKTSLLRLVDWLLNEADLEVLSGSRPVPDSYVSLLTPARDTRNRARRLTLEFAIADMRRHKRFRCVQGIAQLRVDMRVTPRPELTLHIGPPRRDGARESEPEALGLLELVRKELSFVLIPSFRDAASSRFRDSLQQAFRARLSQRALHQKQAGAPAEYRQVLRAQRMLKDVAEDLAQPLWDAMNVSVPAGLARAANIELSVQTQDLVEWMASKLSLSLTTGAHDIATVPPVEVGSGLQSLLDVAIQLSEGGAELESLVLAVEEPEAFLHPSAQRGIARHLLAEGPAKRIISTHSPIVVAEARFDQVVVVHEQQFYPPKTTDARREEINTSLLGGRASEMLFHRSVLFVEGEGDRLFFEALRRRIAVHDKSGRTDALGIVVTGSCSAFGPWIELVRAYGKPGASPFEWLIVADGDATTEVEQALKDATVAVPAAVKAAFASVRTAKAQAAPNWAAACESANRACRIDRLPVYLSPIDLEYLALGSASQATLDALKAKAGLGASTKDTLLKELGSKVLGSPSNKPKKAPWIRAFVGQTLPWGELTDSCKRVLYLWLRGVMPKKEATDLLDSVARAGG